MNSQFNEKKFIEMVLYVAENTLDDPNFGATKLAKALWRADFVAFGRLGTSISGAEYQKLDFGPAAREFQGVFNEMQKSGVAAQAAQLVEGYNSWRLVALREAEVGVFSPEELSIIHSAITYVKSKTAGDLSRESHGWAWEAVNMKELIPYGSELFPNAPLPPSDEATEYGEKLVKELAL